MNATIHIKDFSEFNETRSTFFVSLATRFLTIFPKTNFLYNLIAKLERKLVRSVTKDWTKFNQQLLENISFLEELSVEDAEISQKKLKKIIDKLIDLNENFEKYSYPIDSDYKLAYKNFLRTLGKSDNILHRKITKGNPVQRTPEDLRQGVSNLNMESLSKKLSV